MEYKNLTINLRHNLPLTNGFISHVYIKERKTKKRINIGHIVEKSGLSCVLSIKKEFVDITQTLKFSLDTHIVNGCKKIVGLSFYK